MKQTPSGSWTLCTILLLGSCTPKPVEPLAEEGAEMVSQDSAPLAVV